MTTLPAQVGLLLLGALALGLVSFPPRDAGVALGHAFVRPLSGQARRRAACFWEAMARSLLVVGAFLAALGLVSTISQQEPSSTLTQLIVAHSFGPFALAMALALACVLAASRGSAIELRDSTDADADHQEQPPRSRLHPVQAVVGYLVLAGLLAAAAAQLGERPGFRPVDWLFRPAAWLTTAGVALAMALYRRESDPAAAETIALGSAGALCALAGLIHALRGFGASSVPTVAAGLVFALSSCAAALVGLGVYGLPREDRRLLETMAAPCRLVWYGVPLLTVLVVTVAWLLASTPMRQLPH
jgi:hypothetical protein